mgnify:CR=1 FL=1
MRLAGKTAIVTGASRGIGRAVAQRLLREQKRLLSFYNKNLPSVDSQTGEVALYLFSVVVLMVVVEAVLDKVEGRRITFTVTATDSGVWRSPAAARIARAGSMRRSMRRLNGPKG